MMIDLSDYSSVTGFGDSIVDSGNVAIIFGFFSPTRPSQGFVDGRFSNGPNYFDLLFSTITGGQALTYAPSLDTAADGAFGLNYAVGGTTAQDDLSLQVNGFGQHVADSRVLGGSVAVDDLFVISMGGNDLLDFVRGDSDGVFTASEIAGLAGAVSGAIGASVDGLVAVGAQNILVAAPPNVGVAPGIVNDIYAGSLATSIAGVAPVSDGVRDAVAQALLDIRLAMPDVEIFFFDADFTVVLDDPSSFGLDAALLSTPFIGELAAGRATLNDIGSYAFMDDVHPTAVIQEQLAVQASAAQLVGSVATNGDDQLVGSRGSDDLFGLAGADFILGGAGNDYIVGD